MRTYLINEQFPAEYKQILEQYGKAFPLPVSSAIPLPVGAHPDTLIGKIGSMLFVYENDRDIISLLENIGAKYTVVSKKAGALYPDDCAMNFFTVQSFIVGKLDTIAPEVLEYASENGYEPINVKQGYAHCTSAVINNGVITADRGIFSAMSERNIPSLLTEDGDILLPPFDYGFIGGACGEVNETTVMFFGSLSSHRNGSLISEFCKNQGVSITENNGKLFDFGGFICINT